MGSTFMFESASRQQLLIKKFHHPTFGAVSVFEVSNTRERIAKISISFNQQEALEKYRHEVDLAKSYNMPSLLKVLGYQIQEGPGMCAGYRGNITFQYHQQTLDQVIHQKKIFMNQFKERCPKIAIQCKDIKLNNYKQIDSLSSIHRKYINVFYREVEILEMIDHVIGAVYFLRHFQFKHQAIRPSTIFVDTKGKYMLVDRNVFRVEKNYAQAFQYVTDHRNQIMDSRIIQQNRNFYLSPQVFYGLKDLQTKPKKPAQKLDIFAVGLIALEMCLLEDLSHIYDYRHFIISKNSLNKLLVRVKSRYSQQLVQLLQSMLHMQTQQRISIKPLIEQLTPLLEKNLQQLQQVYRQPEQSISNSHSQSSSAHCSQFVSKILSMNNEYRRVLTSANKNLVQTKQSSKDGFRNEEKRIVGEILQLQRGRDVNHIPEEKSLDEKESSIAKLPQRSRKANNDIIPIGRQHKLHQY